MLKPVEGEISGGFGVDFLFIFSKQVRLIIWCWIFKKEVDSIPAVSLTAVEVSENSKK